MAGVVVEIVAGEVVLVVGDVSVVVEVIAGEAELVVGAVVVVMGYGVLFSHPTADGQLQTFKLVSN